MPRSAELFESPDPLALDWKGLYQEHAPRLRRIAERRVGSEQADDVVQDAFMRAYRNRSSLDPSRPIGAWLCSITLCSSTDALRRRSARPELAVDGEEEPPVEGGRSVEDEFDNMVRRVGIEQAFESLNQRQRRVLQRLEIDGWTQEEVAAVEHLSTEAVKSLAARARRTFRDAYAAFAENMGVFGGAALGPALWRLRTRVQRVQAAAGEHVGAFGVAAVTVTVVAIATVPSTRPVPTRAAESNIVNATEPGAGATTAMVAGPVPALPEPATTTSSPIAAPVVPPLSGSVAANEPQTPVTTGPVSTDTTAKRTGQGAEAGFNVEDASAVGNGRAYGGVKVDDCDANIGTRAECAVIDAVAGAFTP